GHIEEADVTITTDYTTAKALFVAGDQQLAMQAFMSGKIMVTGDIAKIMTMQASAVSRTELQLEVATRLQELTAD
ncbi:MAG: SCP2 sterol-binding domain-containing protein, partial [Actinomycetota bacterium]|nr:SCP2 sterol-binding domain-containing protein [Actinomycetota bacterium]